MIIAIGLLLFTGILFLLKSNFFSIIIGLILIGNAINLSIFFDSKPQFAGFAFTKLTETSVPMNDPVPQALVLTAIVIGFALLSFFISLVKASSQKGTDLNSPNFIKEDADE